MLQRETNMGSSCGLTPKVFIVHVQAQDQHSSCTPLSILAGNADLSSLLGCPQVGSPQRLCKRCQQRQHVKSCTVCATVAAGS